MCLNDSGCRNLTFMQLKPRLVNILMMTIQVESDAENTHMLLGGLMLSVQDSVAYEGTENNNADATTTSDSNLLSSGEWRKGREGGKGC